MNIFYLSESPVECAQSMVDRHVVKMILETAQLLSTAHRVLDGTQQQIKVINKNGKLKNKKIWILSDSRNDILYAATHINHPSCIWTRQSVENYNWLVEHLFALSDEYTHRYGKRHKTIERLGFEIQSPPYNLKEYDMTLMPSCMDKEYIISDDPIMNYRNYYKYGKKHIHAWKRRDPPDWINIGV